MSLATPHFLPYQSHPEAVGAQSDKHIFADTTVHFLIIIVFQVTTKNYRTHSEM